MYEQRVSDLPYVQCVWRASVVQADEYDDPAKDTWGLAFTRRVDGAMSAELLGQSFNFRVLDSTVGDEYWGVEFYPYVTMRGVDKPAMTGKLVHLRVADGRFFIGDDAYAIPSYDELEAWCERLASQGIISHTTRHARMSVRSQQRAHRQTVGLTRKQVQQIKRAEHVAQLLKQGASPTDAASEAGYADQAHMTRSLKALLGKTPSQLS